MPYDCPSNERGSGVVGAFWTPTGPCARPRSFSASWSWAGRSSTGARLGSRVCGFLALGRF
eukprot:3669172-Alexandrium_andersonii.AAC.1